MILVKHGKFFIPVVS